MIYESVLTRQWSRRHLTLAQLTLNILTNNLTSVSLNHAWVQTKKIRWNKSKEPRNDSQSQATTTVAASVRATWIIVGYRLENILSSALFKSISTVSRGRCENNAYQVNRNIKSIELRVWRLRLNVMYFSSSRISRWNWCTVDYRF